MIGLTVLGIETSSKTASVALLRDGVVLASETVYTRLTHSQTIIPMVERALKNAELRFDDIEKIAVSAGPGSYTGIRIGIAAVKGMCLKGSAETCGVSTLLALGYGLLPYRGFIAPIMRARDGVAYFGMYRSNGERLERIREDTVITEEALCEEISKVGEVMLTGDWAEHIKESFFAEDDKVSCAPKNKLLQDAVSVCAAAEFLPSVSADELSASYLQATKAQRDRQHR